ncbi:glucokinase [Neorhizobium galegae]|uniref:glucokinase n=1 Tax=Neorhizobium galegae TaxID=399 RepID=UPI001AE43D3E|nr:glucokinase [Neorhizobium galegae]MBP2562451.1 glucokinase [Neorhizobium galegae]
MSMSSARHAVVGEIGCHHLRFAVADVDELMIDHLVNFKTEDFTSVQQALFSYLKSLGTPPKIVSLAIAGSVEGDRAHIFNSPRTVKKRELQSALSLDRVEVATDAEAIAKVTELLSAHDLHQIAGAIQTGGGPRTVAIIGEGVRTAVAIPAGQQNLILSTRAGDMSFGAANDEDLWFLEQVHEDIGDRTAESLLAVDGLMALYNVASRQAGTAQSSSTVLDILSAASVHGDPVAIVALERYALWLARFARDVALATGARGGIYLAGDLPAKLVQFLDGAAFKTIFEAARGASHRMPDAPVYLVTGPSAALRGAAMAIA